MEESEKRKERLRVMRMEASRVESLGTAGTSGGIDHLANPLIETAAVTSGKHESHAAPRFDYYTDPLSAFSGNRVRSSLDVPSPQAQFATSGYGAPMPGYSPSFSGPRSFQTSPSPAHQWQTNLPSYGGMDRPGPNRGPTHQPSPRASGSHFQMHRGVSPQSWNTSPHYLGRGSPCASQGDYKQGAYSGGGSGRGWHQRLESSPNSGGSGGRGLGFRGRGSSPGVALGPERFYHESMVEDPWKGLTPVLWKGMDFPTEGSDAPGSSSSWMPKSIQRKKQRVVECPAKFGPGMNLAEILAATFNEPASEASNP